MMDNIIRELADLPGDSIVTEKALARMLGKKNVRAISRAVLRGEIPPGVRLCGKPVWTAAAILAHLNNRLAAAQEKALRERHRIAKFLT